VLDKQALCISLIWKQKNNYHCCRRKEYGKQHTVPPFRPVHPAHSGTSSSHIKASHISAEWLFSRTTWHYPANTLHNPHTCGGEDIHTWMAYIGSVLNGPSSQALPANTVTLVHLFSCTCVFQWYHFTLHSRSRHPGKKLSTCWTKLPPQRDWCTVILAFERSSICEYLKAVVGLGDSPFIPSICRACFRCAETYQQ